MLDLIIKNAMIPDFEQGEMVKAEVGIKDGIIVSVGKVSEEAREVLDAGGRVLSPGFIDVHMHEDDFTLQGERYEISNYMLKMGVTTCVGGNCGNHRQDLRDFKHTIEKLGGAPVNYYMLTGYNHHREALGVDRYETVTEAQMEEIKARVREELAEGAMGISFGIEYHPGMTKEEILEILTLLDPKKHLAAAHYRSDATEAIEAIEEMIEIADESGIPFQISHLSSCSAMGQMDEALEIIGAAMKRNPGLNYDTYPYNCFSTKIGSAVFDEGCFERWGCDESALLIPAGEFEGQRCTPEIFKKLRQDAPETLVIAFAMEEDEIRKSVINEVGMIASDALITEGKGHPRAAGTFPRALAKYVREEKAMELIRALDKFTRLPARQFKLGRRGEIKPGYIADLVLFDPETIEDGPDFASLDIPNQGIEKVYLGGKLALDRGDIVDGHRGRFLVREDEGN